MEKPDILLIGGSNIDFLAKSFKTLIPSDSNPGELSISYGGVGRNIAENLALLNDRVTFITGIGNDTNGEGLVKQLEKRGVKVIFPKPTASSSSYIAICDETGDMQIAVCDSRAIDNLSAEFIKEHEDVIKDKEYVFFETNLAQKTIEKMIKAYPDKKWCVEAVSVNKVTRLSKIIDKIYLFKGNLLEGRKAAGLSNGASIEEVLKALLNKGVKKAVITQGCKPVFYADENGIHQVEVEPLNPKEIINATGAGDAMFAGIIHMMNKGASLEECIRFGQKVSNMSLKCAQAVNERVKELTA